MAYTFDGAYTAVTDYVLAAWLAGVPAIVGIPNPELRFQDVERDTKFQHTGARFVMDSVTNPQSSLRNAEFGQRYANNGIIIVQLLVKRGQVDAAERMRKLGDYLKDIFRNPAFPDGFILQNIRVNRLEPEPDFLRANVIVEYQFDELT